jgi:DNA-binding MarR family transcriptional regulator
MNMVDAPYSIWVNEADAHEFDLKDLGDRRYVHVATVGFNDGRKQTYGYDADIKVEDYDRQFREKLRKLNPPQRVRDFLDHHKVHFEGSGKDVAMFLDHFRYNILHQLEQHNATSPNTTVARDWYDKIMNNIHKQHQVTKAKYLSRAFDLALERDPVRPTRVQIRLDEIADILDIDAELAQRIRDELAQDGLVKRIGNYRMFLVEPEGRRAVERMHAEGTSTLPIIVQNHYSASGGSILQVTNASPHATQTANVGDVITELRSFTEELSARMPQLKTLIEPELYMEIQEDLDYIKRKLQVPTVSRPLLQTAKEELVKKLVALPLEVAKVVGLASMIPT